MNFQGRLERIIDYSYSRGPIVTESTIIPTIHCPDVGYCLFGNLLVTYIPYHAPCTSLIVIVSYWVLLSLVRLLAPLAPYAPIGILYASYCVLLV